MARFSCAVSASASRFIQASIRMRPVLWSWAIAGTRPPAFQLLSSSQFIGFSVQCDKFASLADRWLSAYDDEQAGHEHQPGWPGGGGGESLGSGGQYPTPAEQRCANQSQRPAVVTLAPGGRGIVGMGLRHVFEHLAGHTGQMRYLLDLALHVLQQLLGAHALAHPALEIRL